MAFVWWKNAGDVINLECFPVLTVQLFGVKQCWRPHSRIFVSFLVMQFGEKQRWRPWNCRQETFRVVCSSRWSETDLIKAAHVILEEQRQISVRFVQKTERIQSYFQPKAEHTARFMCK